MVLLEVRIFAVLDDDQIDVRPGHGQVVLVAAEHADLQPRVVVLDYAFRGRYQLIEEGLVLLQKVLVFEGKGHDFGVQFLVVLQEVLLELISWFLAELQPLPLAVVFEGRNGRVSFILLCASFVEGESHLGFHFLDFLQLFIVPCVSASFW